MINNVIDSKEKFLKYLFFLLSDGEVPEDILGDFGQSKKGENNKGVRFLQIPLFEELLKALSRSPEKIEHIEKVKSSLGEKAKDIIPVEFDDLLSEFLLAKRRINYEN